MPNPVPSAVAESLVAAVSAVPFIDGPDEGRFGEVALLYPRFRAPGLRWLDGRLEVHVRVAVDPRDPAPLSDAARAVRAAAESVLAASPDLRHAPVDVFVADVVPANLVPAGPTAANPVPAGPTAAGAADPTPVGGI